MKDKNKQVNKYQKGRKPTFRSTEGYASRVQRRKEKGVTDFQNTKTNVLCKAVCKQKFCQAPLQVHCGRQDRSLSPESWDLHGYLEES
jgi:hypothetical protein